jgi:leucyl aminopeptidase
LPSKLTILSNNDQNLLDLVNACLLSRYKFEKYKTEKKEDEIYIISTKENEINVKNRLETIENIIQARDL